MADVNTGSLSNLVDIVLPAPAPWWPPAPGWIWASAFLCALAAAWGLATWLRWHRNAYRREAVAELGAEDLTVAQLFGILKRVALVSFGRSEVARLSGLDWMEFLVDSCPDLNRQSLEPLYATVFTRDTVSSSDREIGLEAARNWVRRHRVPDNPRSLPRGRTGRMA
jgi:hypothetical protein